MQWENTTSLYETDFDTAGRPWEGENTSPKAELVQISTYWPDIATSAMKALAFPSNILTQMPQIASISTQSRRMRMHKCSNCATLLESTFTDGCRRNYTKRRGERTIYQTANARSCGNGGRAERVRGTLALLGSRRVRLKWLKVNIIVL